MKLGQAHGEALEPESSMPSSSRGSFRDTGVSKEPVQRFKCSNMIQKQSGEYNALFYVAWPDVQGCSPFYVCVYFKHEPRGQHGISVKQLRDSHGRIWKKGKQSKCL